MISNSCRKPQLKLCPVPVFSFLVGAPCLAQLGSGKGIAVAVPIALSPFQWGESAWSAAADRKKRDVRAACGFPQFRVKVREKLDLCTDVGTMGDSLYSRKRGLQLQVNPLILGCSRLPAKLYAMSTCLQQKGTKGICPTLGCWVSVPGHSSSRCYQCK